MRSLRILSPVLLAATALGVSACGGSDSGSSDPIARAADATRNAGTAQIKLSATVDAAGQTIPMTGEGAMSTRNDAAGRLSMTFTVNGERKTMDEIISKGALYMGGEVLAKQIPGGKRWMKIDMRKLLEKHGVDASRFDQGTGNATKALDYLRGANDVKKLGSEDIGGVPTTHYHATIDLKKAAEKVGDSQMRAAMEKAMGTTTSAPADVWIDKQDRLRRYQFEMPMAQAKMRMTMDFVRYGVVVNTDAPPSDQVFDATALVEKQIATQASG